MISLLMLFACNETPELKGRVVDIWNNPVEGATVVGAGEKPLTDEYGVYSLGTIAAGSYEMKAGKEGYIQESATVEIKDGDKAAPTFRLYKKPESDGFYAVTVGDYRRVEPSTVKSLGHASDTLYGIEAPSEKVFLEGGDVKIVYKIDLSIAQIKSLGLKLRKLKFVESTEMATVAGGTRTEVPVNLFVADSELPLEITPLKSKGFFVLTTKEPLVAGVYALESQDLLAPVDDDTFMRIPETLRTVYPFTVK
ncbi:MAG: carboxypeptidase regulatory-like domain-containing protein [Myxococcales bacterium]|nr:carboxypeptidase regulatory-like domain-containing protein [Myxococcales bacterium]MCB9669765.1 carboxypeptidase regulatory-like domain-containing protein [Alphaproteobacteria bacterium]